MPRVIAGHESGHHARIDGDRAIEQDLELGVRRRIHRPAAQDLNVRMSAANEDDCAKGTQRIVSSGVIGVIGVIVVKGGPI